jgi:hypothetical protein
MGYFNEPPPPITRERGSLLSGWLIFFGVANALSVVRSLEQGNFLTLAWSLFGLVCALGVWKWYRLALYGMFLGFMFNIALALDAASISSILYQLVYIALTYALVQPKMEFFR